MMLKPSEEMVNPPFEGRQVAVRIELCEVTPNLRVLASSTGKVLAVVEKHLSGLRRPKKQLRHSAVQQKWSRRR